MIFDIQPFANIPCCMLWLFWLKFEIEVFPFSSNYHQVAISRSLNLKKINHNKSRHGSFVCKFRWALSPLPWKYGRFFLYFVYCWYLIIKRYNICCDLQVKNQRSMNTYDQHCPLFALEIKKKVPSKSIKD